MPSAVDDSTRISCKTDSNLIQLRVFNHKILSKYFQSHKEDNTVLLLAAVFYCVWATNLVFAVCELGQRFSNAFSEIDGWIGELDWYLLPIEIKRILPTIILYVEQPFVVEFFGSMSCSREQFKKVGQCQDFVN